MTQWITEPRVALISRPTFEEPLHVGVAWRGDSEPAERLCEFAGRACYQSFDNPAERTTAAYLENIMRQGHGSVLEHAVFVLYIEGVSRSLTHELVRHRAGFGYSQLSQRYVDESDTAYVVPPALCNIVSDEDQAALDAWQREREADTAEYTRESNRLFRKYAHVADKVHRRKLAREAARSVLPNSTETKVVVSGNVRAWRHFLAMRSSTGADAEIRRLAVQVGQVLRAAAPALFADFEAYTTDVGDQAGRLTYPKV